MESIHPQHVRHGLFVLDITAPDEAAARLVMASLEQQWATSGITATRRLPGGPGVRARGYAYTRRRNIEYSRRSTLQQAVSSQVSSALLLAVRCFAAVC
ncbi:DUF6207 family protein [Streptomyces sp. NBC_00876]|uniref:DUF6207 family protein n=1 Tax=Streptomyces sp. NBC_00876 TaxID=2975853 RepID=UPI00386CC253|nr:DUF6207 family protein [Streptomyces sp. NBC_00876]